MPAIDRLLLCWPALKSYFASQGEDNATDLIWRGFSCGEDDPSVIPERTLYFVHNVMTIFDEAVICLEAITTIATEIHGIMVNVQSKLQQRRCDKFYGSAATKLLQGDDVSPEDKQKFEREVDNFLGRC